MKAYDLVITSGYFNPLHKGHVEFLTKAKALGEQLLVIVNSDAQVKIKGSKPFMKEEERLIIIEALKVVDKALVSLDKDGSQCATLQVLLEQQKGKKLCFANGGDRHIGDIPEAKICEEYGVELVDGLGEKIQSSSSLLKQ
tara:strand:- start:1553 stop:1975 length:423 start_codon:yes stop_codon:yes gene_type:complete